MQLYNARGTERGLRLLYIPVYWFLLGLLKRLMRNLVLLRRRRPRGERLVLLEKDR